MKLLNKIKSLLSKKTKYAPLFRRLKEDQEIKDFFSRNSGWKRGIVKFHLNQRDKTIYGRMSFSRKLTEEEINSAPTNSYEAAVYGSNYKTLDQVWEKAIDEILKTGKLENDEEPRK